MSSALPSSSILNRAPAQPDDPSILPIVLHHGLGCGNIRWGPFRHQYFRGMQEAIAERYPLLLPRVHPTGGILRRAEQLKCAITDQLAQRGLAHRKVLIVAHSMGGLDARYMISRLGMHDRVAALLTITTPHRGSPYADWMLRHFGRRLRGLRLAAYLGIDIDAMIDLTTESCQRFNEQIPPAPGVRYFSITARQIRRRVPAWAMHAWNVVYEVEGDNDGLVSVQSAAWATHLGTWTADHWHTINHRYSLGSSAYPDITPRYLQTLERVVSCLYAPPRSLVLNPSAREASPVDS